MQLHDTHCHIDLFKDRQTLLNEIEHKGIYTIAVTNAPSVYQVTERLTTGKRFVRPALGLHPELVATHAGELDLFERLLPSVRYIGEVGLDYKHSTIEERRMQRRVFERILSLSNSMGGRILTIHSRGAADDVIDMVAEHDPGTVILHWFSGSKKLLDRANEVGGWFSVNAAMIRNSQGSNKLREFYRERVLLESDGPFVEVQGLPARPQDGVQIVHALAKIWSCGVDEVSSQLQKNFKACLTDLSRNN